MRRDGSLDASAKTPTMAGTKSSPRAISMTAGSPLARGAKSLSSSKIMRYHGCWAVAEIATLASTSVDT